MFTMLGPKLDTGLVAGSLILPGCVLADTPGTDHAVATLNAAVRRLK